MKTSLDFCSFFLMIACCFEYVTSVSLFNSNNNNNNKDDIVRLQSSLEAIDKKLNTILEASQDQYTHLKAITLSTLELLVEENESARNERENNGMEGVSDAERRQKTRVLALARAISKRHRSHQLIDI